jgi:acyl-coenzyme A synthetase/AMP-(fatty) acid ligase
VTDSLVVDLEFLGRDSYMPLFVVLREGLVLDDALTKRMRDVIKTALSARHVPNEIFQVQSIPRTLSGKKMELPVKKLLLGAAPTMSSSSTRWPTPTASPGSPTSPGVALPNSGVRSGAPSSAGADAG